MKKHKDSQGNPKYLKRRLMSALCMLLVATIMLGSTSYAWLVMSTSPEVTGIATQIGANGSLEIALLNTETRQDMDSIKSIGASLVNRDPSANNTWGNLVDLDYTEYGLEEITLWPARLNAIASGNGYTVNSSMLKVPTYGYDGRIVELTDNTLSAIYDGSAFKAILGTQDYGVRAIGTSDTMTAQASALALAKSNITTYSNSAKTAASSALNSNGDALVEIMMNRSEGYGDEELATLKSLVDGLQKSLNYIDLALRQGIVAYAASAIGDEDTFTSVRDYVVDATHSLDDITTKMGEYTELPEEFATWIAELNDTQNDLNLASNAANSLSGGSYTWANFRTVLDYIMNIDYIYVGEDKFTDLDTSNYQEFLTNGIELTLAPGSGVPADIADFTGDISAFVEYMGIVEVEITTLTTQKPVYLTALSTAVKKLEAADGGETGGAEVELNTTYGYALDMAFRCNAAASDLLLQTTPEQRVANDSENERTMGGGSYMEFSSPDKDFGLEQMLTLMDAVRVAFIDDQGSLLGIAKLNTSNRTVEDDTVKAPLYLYGFEFSEEDGSLVMGERQKTSNVITSLEQSVATAVTVLVWLDGDVVDNSDVAATEELSLVGNLNLQFSSSANLVPANNDALANITADKTALDEAITAEQEVVDAGQGLYTTVSWTAYMDAYNNAVAVNADQAASENQIYNAALALATAKAALVETTHETLNAKITEVREFMGQTTDLARYVLADYDGNYYSVDEYTEDELAGWTILGEIYRVDYANNLNDEGEGIMTPIYTDESWSNLAVALYDAETVDMDANASDDSIDAALTALETAYDALTHNVYYIPHEYEGTIYYFAISEETDTYGKWYYNDFTRVVSDLTILKLDANAEPVSIVEVNMSDYIAVEGTVAYPRFAFINILDEIYPELADEEVIGAAWSEFDTTLFTEIMNSRHANTLFALIQQANDLGLDTTGAQAIYDRYPDVPATEAVEAIVDLETRINEKLQSDADGSTDMTADQRTVLTSAVNAAQSIVDANDAKADDDETKKDLSTLKNTIAAANALLAAETGATKTAADTALNALNAAMVDAGGSAVTASNTIVHTVPVGSEVYEVVNAIDYPSISLAPTGKTGVDTITATIVTRSGVVCVVSKQVNLYTYADELRIHDADGYSTSIIVSLSVGERRELDATLVYRLTDEEIAIGNGTANAPEFGEEIVSYTWASTDTSVLSVAADGTLTAKSAGTATITVSVETKAGNVYTDELTFTVTE